jgi:hypothetical protein
MTGGWTSIIIFTVKSAVRCTICPCPMIPDLTGKHLRKAVAGLNVMLLLLRGSVRTVKEEASKKQLSGVIPGDNFEGVDPVLSA